jgi:hypothetical protein
MLRYAYIHPGRYTAQNVLELDALRKKLETAATQTELDLCFVLGCDASFSETLGNLSGAREVRPSSTRNILVPEIDFDGRIRCGVGQLHDDGSLVIWPFIWSAKNCDFRRDMDWLEDGQVTMKRKLTDRDLVIVRGWLQPMAPPTKNEKTAWARLSEEDPWG